MTSETSSARAPSISVWKSLNMFQDGGAAAAPWTPEDVANIHRDPCWKRFYRGHHHGCVQQSEAMGSQALRDKTECNAWRRREGRRPRKGERATIDGPDGQVLKSWTVDKDGEHETDGE